MRRQQTGQRRFARPPGASENESREAVEGRKRRIGSQPRNGKDSRARRHDQVPPSTSNWPTIAEVNAGCPREFHTLGAGARNSPTGCGCVGLIKAIQSSLV